MIFKRVSISEHQDTPQDILGPMAANSQDVSMTADVSFSQYGRKSDGDPTVYRGPPVDSQSEEPLPE